MTRLVWLFGWAAVAIWSLVCWAAYGLFDLFGRFAMRNADALASDPDVVEGIWRLLSALHSLSTGVVLVVWALVSLLILAVPWVLSRMVGGAGATVTVRRTAGRGFPGPGVRPSGFGGPAASGAGSPAPGARFGRDEGVIDLAPDQYTVRPAPETRAGTPGPTPRIPPGR